jgi:hypothetical protein
MKRTMVIFFFLASVFQTINAGAQSSIDSLRTKITMDSLKYVSAHMGEKLSREREQGISTSKLFSIMVPSGVLLVFFFVLMTIMQIQANKQLKIKMIEKGISEETLIKLFSVSGKESAQGALKWALLLGGVGVGLAGSQAYEFGALSLGIVAMSAGLSFFIYYLIVRKKGEA